MKYSKIVFRNLCIKYNLTKQDETTIYRSIKPILFHKEFIKRLDKEFYHHGTTTLGEHILEDTIITYKLAKNKDINLDLALKISMMHDLYTTPWQNNPINKQNTFHRHGFSHPIDAAINSMVWFKKEFKNPRKAEILIDGIVHHMYPLPVTAFYTSNTNELELDNFDLIKKIDKRNIKILIDSSNRNKIGKVSLSRSKYKEGRIMSKADKKVTLKQLTNVNDYASLVTGYNKSIINNE